MADLAKLVSALVLLTVIALAVGSRPPRRATGGSELGRLMLATLLLYGAGAGALVSGRSTLGASAIGLGVTLAALTAWLSRGGDSGEPPGGPPPRPGPSAPSDPDAPEPIDWDRFDRERRGWTRPAVPDRGRPVSRD